jgi:diguanylate cyclase (GGDEF)-like protein/PAS domain S-box-containing protein
MNGLKQKILFIEDDEVDRMAFLRFAKKQNLPYEIRTASSGREAGELLSAEKFDVVLSDYNLGDCTAFDIVDFRKSAPVILITGAGDEEVAVQAMHKGAYDYIRKDLDREYLKLIPITIENVIQRKSTEEQLKLLSTAIMTIYDSVYITDNNNKIIFVNKTFCATYGYTKEEVLDKSSHMIWVKEKRDPSKKSIFRKTTKDCWTDVYSDRTKDGRIIHVSMTASVIRNSDGETIAIVRVAHDITERQRLEETLRRLSFLDSLTKVSNRRNFDSTLDFEWRRCMRDSLPISVCMIDIDYFKQYNDRYGHQAGDLCLQKVAHSINNLLQRAGDVVARYGGEEFALILPNIDIEGAVIISEHIRARVEELDIQHEASKTSGSVTISIGVANVIPSQNSSPLELVRLADKALYDAKKEGRNRCRRFKS